MEVKILENLRFSLFLRPPSLSDGRNQSPAQPETSPEKRQSKGYRTVCGIKFCYYFAFQYICTMSRTLRGTQVAREGWQRRRTINSWAHTLYTKANKTD